MNRSLHPPTRILNIYIEALTGFSHISNLNGLNNTLLSSRYVFGKAASLGIVDVMYIARMVGG